MQKKISFAGIIDGPEERFAVLEAMASGWHGAGKQNDMFEKELGEYLGIEYVLTTNSGSSANLLALQALELPKGSKVITSGCGFPATLAPIIHLGLEPVLVDYSISTHNIDLDQVEAELEKGDVKAIIFAHTMGNPVDMDRLMELAGKYQVKVIEDCCEALGSKMHGQYVGTFGDLATFSFYPSHQINGLGMGGAVVTNNREYALRMRSLRNWGKIARLPNYAGDHITSYENKIDGIPYDEHYTYQTVGYNMMMPDVNAAYARQQLKRLPGFIARRKETWEYFRDNLKDLPGMPVLPVSEPAYFGYTLLVPDRDSFSQYLEEKGIRTRPFFAGNITRHEPFRQYFKELPIADQFMEHGLFFGVWPGITNEQREYIVQTIKDYFK